MRPHAASNTPCALLRSLPTVSGAALDISSARSCPQKNRAAIRADTYQIQPHITGVDRVVIRDYFHQHNLDELVRPAWKKSLFPGAHRQLLPQELESQLSVAFPGHERILVGSDVLLVETATREIVDVMRNARTGPERHAARERDGVLTSTNLLGGQSPATRYSNARAEPAKRHGSRCR